MFNVVKFMLLWFCAGICPRHQHCSCEHLRGWICCAQAPESCDLECGVVLRLLVIDLVTVCPRGIPRLSRYVVRCHVDRDLMAYGMVV